MDHNDIYLYTKCSVEEQETMMINSILKVLTECKNKHFHKRTNKCWYRLPREVAETPSLEVFKTCLEKMLSNLAKLKYCTCFEQEARLGQLSRSLPMWMIMWFDTFRANQIVSLVSFARDTYWYQLPSQCANEEQVLWPSSIHCFTAYPHPKNIITTPGNEQVWY